MHALLSAVREVCEVPEVSAREPGSASRSHPLSVGPHCQFGYFRNLRNGNRLCRRAGAPGSARPGTRPDGPRPRWRKASWFRIDEAKNGNAGTPRNMPALYNPSIIQSTTEVSR